MREIGFSKRWEKLRQPEFTTFRCRRRDRDWQAEEMVRVVFHPRGKDREVLGIAQITGKEARVLNQVTDDEARADGFVDLAAMVAWLTGADSEERVAGRMSKLTLKWRSGLL